MIERQGMQALCEWKTLSTRQPLLVRGARQVGKSYLINQFGKTHFDHVCQVNFELAPELKSCFDTLNPHTITQNLSLILQQPINPGQTLLFLDEIQDCPQAIRALRYFKEQLPELHVIGAASLLEHALNATEFRMPVGRVSFFHLYPLSFQEFLAARHPDLEKALHEVTWSHPLPEALHGLCLNLLHEYTMTGGLPGICSAWLTTQNVLHIQAMQTNLLETYTQDFAHTTTKTLLPVLQICWERLPQLIGDQIKYHKIEPNIRSRIIKEALRILEQTHLMHRIQATHAQGLPLQAGAQPKRFKMQHLDIGLVKRQLKLETMMTQKDIMLVNRGELAEQLVGQELLAYAPSYERHTLHFWAREGHGRSEIDFLTVIEGTIFPLEVKAGKTGRLRALQVFLNEHPHSPWGLHLSSQPLARHDRILSIPLYMMHHLKRLVLSA